MPSPTNKAQDNSIRENVYRVIRENITSLQLAPGTTVSTQELAAKLQVSRTRCGRRSSACRKRIWWRSHRRKARWSPASI